MESTIQQFGRNYEKSLNDQKFEDMPDEIHGFEVQCETTYGTEKCLSFVVLQDISEGVGFTRPVCLDLRVSHFCENPEDDDDHEWYYRSGKSLLACARAAWLESAMDNKRNGTMFEEYDIGCYRWDFNAIIESPGSIQELPLALWYSNCDGYYITVRDGDLKV